MPSWGESEARVGVLLQHAWNVISVFDRDLVRRYVSPTSERVLGYLPEELIGHSIFEIGHPDEAERARAFVAELSELPGAVRSSEIRARHRDGSYRWLEVVVANCLDDPDIAGYVSTSRDITERRQAEEQLRTSEERLRLALDAARMGTWDWSMLDGTLTWSTQAEALHGLAPRTFDGTYAAFIATIHPDDRDALNDRVQQAIEHLADYEAEFRALWPDGAVRWLKATGQVLPDANGVATRLIGITMDITGDVERKTLEQRLVHQAYHDPLTGLPNRALLMDRLNTTLGDTNRTPRSLAVLVVTIDRFHVVVDALGHEAADRVLAQIGHRLENCLRPEDTVALSRGEKFIILLDHTRDRADAASVAERMLVALRTPLVVNEEEIVFNAAIGMALGQSGEARPEDLLRNAEMAMSRARQGGIASYAVFDPAVEGHAGQRLTMEPPLRRAIELGDLELYYQPEVDLSTGAITGVEALVRWTHPVRGLLLPEAFVPLAEEVGLIAPLGRWVLEAACRQTKSWVSGRTAPLVVAVNLSALHFRQPDLVEDVARCLQAADLPPSCLELEITEHLLVADEETIQRTLSALKSLGVRLVIDDFGVGYSSLSYLHRMPVDAIKIDRSFVSGPDGNEGSETIVRAIAALAHTLGLRVTAEGIETAEQLARVEAASCDRGQGFYFAPPVPPAALTPLLEQPAPYRR